MLYFFLCSAYSAQKHTVLSSTVIAEELESVKSFRHTHVDLQLFAELSIGTENVITINSVKHICNRMCYINNNIYLTCPYDHCITICSLEGARRWADK